MKVAVLGLGAMGSQLLLRLLDEGVEAVGWNRDRARGPRAGIPATHLAPTPAEAVRDADVVLTMLTDGRAVRAVLTDALAALPAGALVLDLSTSGPELSRATATLLTEHGLRYAETPVSGSVTAARTGTLTLLFGGGADELATAEPVLRHLGRQTLHIGPVGTASAMKLCVNALLHTFNATLGEVLGAAVDAGIDLRTAYDTIASSAIAAPFVAYKRDAFLTPDLPPVACAVDVVGKDLDLFLTLRPGLDAPTVRTAVDVVHRAQAAGLGPEDMATLARLYRP
ncbi:NAD(P)-dependent oxidoreductase [Amycolatopsis rhabdoformis]|uniref:NAD(P)-dependent oxidoreductase n=1 Tax=Amycolatopsis rhabdoformis TaxID=1448059 RepID=A0ABZ1IKE0_9PSEU|nr:NAD(P)-dependent oxidoreductase [Amycolatopsis rhabdoformis]WSE34202.1 NAD(P)-dependent oxidoreductase [Amycolatopsis rhabdoformis]